MVEPPTRQRPAGGWARGRHVASLAAARGRGGAGQPRLAAVHARGALLGARGRRISVLPVLGARHALSGLGVVRVGLVGRPLPIASGDAHLQRRWGRVLLLRIQGLLPVVFFLLLRFTVLSLHISDWVY